MFGLQLHVSSAGGASCESAAAVDVRLSGWIRRAHGVEDRSGVGVVKAGGEGGATAVVRPLIAGVNSGVASPRCSQVGRFRRWIGRDRCRDAAD